MTAKKIVSFFGVVFIIIGILGFFSNGKVLGIFAVDTIHNVIHLASGIVALAMAARGEAAAKQFGMIFGLVYGLVTVLGFVWPNDNVLGFININTADDFLHLVLSVVFLWVGFRRDGAMTRNA
jgi:hypothetical protein